MSGQGATGETGGGAAGRVADGGTLAEALEAGLSVLVFGGPYSNLQSILAMREIARRSGIPAERVICTGDVVAYCGDPNETCGVIREWGCHVIAGNCEEQLAARARDCGCGFADGTVCDALSAGWYAYADNRLNDDNRAWMARLPRMLRFRALGRRWAVIHGGVTQTSQFVFASTATGVKARLAAEADADIVMAGHCGLPFIQKLGARGAWINGGVIGMPANDGTRDGWYAVVAPVTQGLAVSTHRLAYDADAAAVAAQSAAPAYAGSLLTGRWPSLDVLPETERLAAGAPIAETLLVLPPT